MGFSEIVLNSKRVIFKINHFPEIELKSCILSFADRICPSSVMEIMPTYESFNAGVPKFRWV